KTMTLDAVEFIRRFLLHILPGGFVRIRQFGFLANRARRAKLVLCRVLLGISAAPAKAAATDQRDGKVHDKQCPANQAPPEFPSRHLDCSARHLPRAGLWGSETPL